MYKIVIVDDEEATRSRLLNLLDKEKENFNVIGAFQNGFDVLEELDSLGEFDILISDIKMPFVNGLDLAKELKENYPLLQIILMQLLIHLNLFCIRNYMKPLVKQKID